ncbi:class I SAM-dependent methyltransferase [Flammeovirga sp. SubArs3]|uniref:class I SAM-dependent methyltransferase n=1 Tax=Flammeovirga sp. SubArs3 TaxID=2995316 RepID=UPI00248BFCF6|nr:class I SAM-dependent methyltransferase [Flammeovirga sp. SubArs3]
MERKLTEEELKELEAQLSCPEGDNGIEVGNLMNESNIPMTKSSIRELDIQDENTVLELGHGNCGHLNLIIDAAEDVYYFGLEVSKTMWIEAQRINITKQAEFRLYDGKYIPFPENHFDRVLSVNSIYFWEEPLAVLESIENSLKVGGQFVLTFAHRSFMKKLPFVGDKFTLYEVKDIQELIKPLNLIITEVTKESDEVKNKSGEKVLRTYSIVKMVKM